MGVQGLWDVLAPIGKRVAIETLSQKRLAIDASIWLVQFLKAMRDEEGKMARNAHLLGVWRRLCKLLFFNIRPVFVFDGATPSLKRKTILERRRLRDMASSKLRKTAEKLLMNRLKEVAAVQANAENIQQLVKSAAKGKGKVSDNGGSGSGSGVVVGGGSGSGIGGSGSGVIVGGGSGSGIGGSGSGVIVGGGSGSGSGSGGCGAIGVKERGALSLFDAYGNGDDVSDDEETRLALQEIAKRDAAYAELLQQQEYWKNKPDFPGTAADDDNDQQWEEDPVESDTRVEHGTEQTKQLPQSQPNRHVGRSVATPLPDLDEGEDIMLLPQGSDIDTEAFAQLPAALQQDIITQLKQSRRLEAREKFIAVKDLSKFSQLQIDNYLSLTATERKLRAVQSAGALGDGIGGMPSRKIASDDQREYIFVKSKEKEDVTDRLETVDEENPSVKSKIPQQRVLQNFVSLGSQSSLFLEPLSSTGKSESGGEEKERIEYLLSSSLDRPCEQNPVELKGIPAKRAPSTTAMTPKEKHRKVISLTDSDESDDGGSVGDIEVSVNTEASAGDSLDVTINLENVQEKDVNPIFLTAFAKPHEGSHRSHTVLSNDGKGAGAVDGGDVAVDGGDVAVDGGDVAVDGSDVAGNGHVNGGDNDACDGGDEDSHAEDVCYVDVSSDEELNQDHSSSDDLRNSVSRDSGHAIHLTPIETCTNRNGRNNTEIKDTLRIEQNTPVEYVNVGNIVMNEELPVPTEADDINDLSTVELSKSEEDEPGREVATVEQPKKLADKILDGFNLAKDNCGNTVHDESEESTFARKDGGEEHGARGTQTTSGGSHTEVSGGTHLTTGNFNACHGGIMMNQPPAQIRHNTAEPSTFPEIDKVDDDDESRSLALPITVAPVLRKPESRPTDLISGADSTNAADAKRRKIDECPEVGGAIVDGVDQTNGVNDEAIESMNRQIAELEAQNRRSLPTEEQFEEHAEERRELAELKNRQQRDSDQVTGEMMEDVKELLELLGVPYIVAPMEAEAQCAFLEQRGLVDGVITDDSDTFLFGGQRVYKNIFDQRKYVEAYNASHIEKESGWTRDKLVHMALLLGSDYTSGVRGIGIVNASEILSVFDGFEGLKELKDWVFSIDNHTALSQGKGAKNIFKQKHSKVKRNWEFPSDFPSQQVVDAYMNPNVDRSEEPFEWALPNVEAVRSFCFSKFGWESWETDKQLTPVLKSMEEKTKQTRLDDFLTYEQSFAEYRSVRMKRAVTIAKKRGHQPNADDGKPQAQGKKKRLRKKSSSKMDE